MALLAVLGPGLVTMGTKYPLDVGSECFSASVRSKEDGSSAKLTSCLPICCDFFLSRLLLVCLVFPLLESLSLAFRVPDSLSKG